jgi:hypothetical protein
MASKRNWSMSALLNDTLNRKKNPLSIVAQSLFNSCRITLHLPKNKNIESEF